MGNRTIDCDSGRLSERALHLELMDYLHMAAFILPTAMCNTSVASHNFREHIFCLIPPSNDRKVYQTAHGAEARGTAVKVWSTAHIRLVRSAIRRIIARC